MYSKRWKNGASLQHCAPHIWSSGKAEQNNPVIIIGNVIYLVQLLRYLDPQTNINTGPNVASLKAECGAKFSWAKSPGFVFWCKHYFALKNEDTILYEFKTDLVCIE